MSEATPGLSDQDFDNIRQLVRNRSGISVSSDKRINAYTRLKRLARSAGHASIAPYCEQVLGGVLNEAEFQHFIDAFTTNYTFFHRERAHFEHYEQVSLPEAIARQRGRGRDLRVWSAACSTGEEPYQLAMLLREGLGAEFDGWKAGVLATDLSTRVLRIGKSGLYEHDQVGRLPEHLKARYFKGHEDRLSVADTLRASVIFRRFNLMQERYPFKRAFDVVFCRNVMIYFERAVVDKLTATLASWLVPGGYLYVGHSERPNLEGSGLERVAQGVFRKVSR